MSTTVLHSLLDPLIEMGIPVDRAVVALQRTHNSSVDAALNWICEHPEDRHYTSAQAPALPANSAAQPGAADDSDSDESEDSNDDGELYKMVLVVRQDLKMTSGKIAAQCVHAALGAYREADERYPEYLARWERQAEPVVCLKIDSEPAMLALLAQASETLPCYVVQDAGRTQVASGSRTVLAIGPGPIPLINSLTGHLKLQ